MTKTTVTYELTALEKKTIDEMRARSKAQKDADAYAQHLLEVATAARQWCADTSQSLTYTHFVDEDKFGYEGYEGVTRKATYDMVLRIINSAEHLASDFFDARALLNPRIVALFDQQAD